jgi:hypothetical protein
MRTFIALQYSLYIIGVVTLFGGSFFLLSSGYLKSDRIKAENAVALAAVEEERNK